jgi:hypothetical protein
MKASLSNMRFQALTVAYKKMTVFWDVLCNLQKLVDVSEVPPSLGQMEV